MWKEAKDKSPRQPVIILLGLVVLGVLLWLNGSRQEQEQMVFSYGLSGRVIVIDPGHGGLDSGASRGDLVEKEITLQIAKKLEHMLSQSGALVVLLRGNESDLAGDEFTGAIREHKQEDMRKRVKLANEAGADLFISIHTNAVPSPSWSGAQAFYKPGSPESKAVAVGIQKELQRILGNTKRSAGAGNYYVLKNVQMPAVLVEVGFISNPEEGRLLANSQYQDRVAYAILAGMASSLLGDKSPAPSQ
ncbi:MAG TPA: N-acetylmuramoyl-L-alanine amidase [Syntrophomonadaceae bacterium]|nr:N-acetylmuramoyl-L-alanine amidase [Syntrophomonadaceae bacterium]